MARRTSRRKSRRSSRARRRTRRNPRWVVANRRRRRSSRRRGSRRSSRGRRRRLRRNIFAGVRWMPEVVVPVLSGTAGFVGARYLGNMLAMRGIGSTDPRVSKTIAAAVGIPAIFALGRAMPAGMVAKHSGAIVLGMGMASAEAWIRNTPLLGGSPAAAAIAAPTAVEDTEAAAGFGAYFDEPSSLGADYYTEGMLGGLGADPADQSEVDQSMNQMEAVSTVIPTGTALPARTMPQFAPVSERFVNRGDRGHAGGMFARHLFSGMMGG